MAKHHYDPIAADYVFWKARAIDRGWTVPPVGSPLETWRDAWIAYWCAMHDYELARRRGEADPGRPVPPHRSASRA